MARHTKTVTIDQQGRDFGKTFVLHEMPTDQGHYWGMRVLAALARAQVEIPDSIIRSGMLGVAAVGFAKILGACGDADVKALVDELMSSCVAILPNPATPQIIRGNQQDFRILPNGVSCTGPMVPDDIEEISTQVFLEKGALLLHMGFLPPEVRSRFESLFSTTTGEIMQGMSIYPRP